MKEYEEKVEIVLTVPKPILNDSLKAKKLTMKGMLFDGEQCDIEDTDPDGYYGRGNMMSTLVLMRTLNVEDAVRLAEKVLGIKGSSGDAMIDIKYLFRRLHSYGEGLMQFDLYNRLDRGAPVLLYHSQGAYKMPHTSLNIPDVLKAIHGGMDDEMNRRRSALGWILCEFFGMSYKQTLDKVYSYSTPAELKYELAEAYYIAGSRYRALVV